LAKGASLGTELIVRASATPLLAAARFSRANRVECRAFFEVPYMSHTERTAWLAFLNTVRTEHFDQVLALRPLMTAFADAA
jgi:hypothetical protein